MVTRLCQYDQQDCSETRACSTCYKYRNNTVHFWHRFLTIEAKEMAEFQHFRRFTGA